MTTEENRIIKFHENMALWCAINSEGFNDYITSVSPFKFGMIDLCNLFHLYCCEHELYNEKDRSLDECYINRNNSFSANYNDFCINRLFEDDDNIPERNKLFIEEQKEWQSFFDKPVIDNTLLYYLINKFEPVNVLHYMGINIEQPIILSYCGEDKKHRLLFNALVSLLYSIITTSDDPEVQNKCYQILQETLIIDDEVTYSPASSLCSALKLLDPKTCESLFKRNGIDFKDYDALLSFIEMGNDNGIIKEITNLRKNGYLGNDSVLIELFVEFRMAQNQSRYVNWSKRFYFGDDYPSVIALLIKRIIEKDAISQDLLFSLRKNICSNIDFGATKPIKKKIKEKDKVIEEQEQRYISMSTRYVNKEKLINMLIDKQWVALVSDRDELVTRLNYFFNDKSSKIPNNPNFTIAWSQPPKAQLICLLIRMLFNKNWDINPKDVITYGVDEKQGKRISPGINSEVIAPLDNSQDVWGPVSRVFSTPNPLPSTFSKDRYKKPERQLNKLVELASDILSCKK